MGIFDGRLDLLLLFIAQVVQIILFILVYIRISEWANSKQRKSAKSFSTKKSDSVHGMMSSVKFSRMLRKRRAHA